MFYCMENGEVESMMKFQHEIDPHLFDKTVHSRISYSTSEPQGTGGDSRIQYRNIGQYAKFRKWKGNSIQ